MSKGKGTSLQLAVVEIPGEIRAVLVETEVRGKLCGTESDDSRRRQVLAPKKQSENCYEVRTQIY